MSNLENGDGGPPVGVSFEQDIRPLFRTLDRDSMRGHFDLWSYDDVVEYNVAIASRLREGVMPCDGAWPPQQVDAFDRWVSGGFER